MKRKETIAIENALHEMTREKRLYGCEEVTIGFYNNGHGNEIVDFMTMDSKGIVKCYEIKVTLPDLRSDAKKSWYGHYNYLVVSEELYNKVDDWDAHISSGVGILVGIPYKDGTCYLESRRRAVQQTPEDTEMLKESLIRSMYWKMDKFRREADPSVTKELQKKLRRTKKERDKYYNDYHSLAHTVSKFERYYAYNRNLDDFDLQTEAKKEKKIWKDSLK